MLNNPNNFSFISAWNDKGVFNFVSCLLIIINFCFIKFNSNISICKKYFINPELFLLFIFLENSNDGKTYGGRFILKGILIPYVKE